MRSKAISSLVILASAACAVELSAQTAEPVTPILCAHATKAIHEKEILRVPKAVSFKDDSGETVYTIVGYESWRRAELEVKRGQRIEITAAGIVRWVPDGIEKIDVSPDGTRPPYRDGWNCYHFPFPEAGIGSLVMRIGRGIYPVGSSRIVEAEDDGFVEFMINDDKLDDNSGSFSVRVKLLDSSN